MSIFNFKIRPYQQEVLPPPFSLDPIDPTVEEQELDREAAIQDVALEQISQISRTPSPALGRTDRLSFDDEEEEVGVFDQDPDDYPPRSLFDGVTEDTQEIAQPLPIGVLQTCIEIFASHSPSPQPMDIVESVPKTPSPSQPPIPASAAKTLMARRNVEERNKWGKKTMEASSRSLSPLYKVVNFS
jgi:hypothetical protein